MNIIKRILYLGYYWKKLDSTAFSKFSKFVQQKHNISKTTQIIDIISNSLKYNISILEYYQFHFYKKTKQEKESFAGTGFMYEYQKKMNPAQHREILSDKLKFLPAYKDYVFHEYISLQQLKATPEIAEKLLKNPSGKVVLKSSDGHCGQGIEIRNSQDFSPQTLISRLEETENDFVEEYVEQHSDLNRLSPSGLNTIRVITQLNAAGEVEILGSRLRITVNSSVDNLAAGNIAAPIDTNSGVVNGFAVYSDITKEDIDKHPITGVKITGFQIPFWKETINLVKGAAKEFPQNKSIGWDVAITNRGPELIEGNHDWCKLLWQLPVKKGLKSMLLKHI